MKLNSLNSNYYIPLFEGMNLAHYVQSTHQQLETGTHSEVSSSRCHQVLQLGIWEGIGSVNNPSF